jgi:mRNA interferase MazF
MGLRRGEVYFVDLDPTIGREQAGRRPVVVVTNDTLNNQPLVVMAIPGTKATRVPLAFLSNVRVPAGEAGLMMDTVFLTFQMRALDHSRFQEAARGMLSAPYMVQLEQAMAWTLALPTGGAGPTP